MCMRSLSKYTYLVFCAFIFSLVTHASGITGSSGNELLYIYLLLFSLLLFILGIDFLIKFALRKYVDWKNKKLELPAEEPIN